MELLSTALQDNSPIPNSENHLQVGDRVTVDGYAVGGVVRFVGMHHTKANPRVGVELDKPVGRNDGTVDGHRYFDPICSPQHGVLVVPGKVHPTSAPELPSSPLQPHQAFLA